MTGAEVNWRVNRERRGIIFVKTASVTIMRAEMKIDFLLDRLLLCVLFCVVSEADMRWFIKAVIS